MGHKVVTDPDYFITGVACPGCTPDPFPVDKTPLYIRMIFHDIIKCGDVPEPPNRYHFKCEQMDGQPCIWQGSREINGNEFVCRWDAFLGLFSLLLAPGGDLYFYGWADPCVFYCDDNFITCPGGFASEGRCLVDFFTALLSPVLNPVNAFVESSQGLYDAPAIGGESGCVRLVQRESGTNALFLLDT